MIRKRGLQIVLVLVGLFFCSCDLSGDDGYSTPKPVG